MTSLVVAGQRYDEQQLLAFDAAQAESALSENARATLQFAHDWLAGGERFTLHTSGSTGEPKPIKLTRSQMEASARATGAALGLHSGQRALVCLPTRYVAGRMMLVRGFVLGLETVVVEPASDPFAELPPTLQSDWQPDFTAFVPLQMQTLLAAAMSAPADSCFGDETERAFRYRRLLDGMQAILLGGGPLDEETQRQVQQLAAPIYHTYAMTETATHIALRRLNGPRATDAFVPLPGVELALDARGCLAIRGAVTNEAWVQTNDLVELRADGSFVWLGRADNVINSGGVKVQAEQVEAAVTTLQNSRPDLAWSGRRLAVTGLPDERLGQVVTLVLEGPPLTAAQEGEIAAVLRAHLDRFATPRRFAYLSQLPLTPTGKIDRAGVLNCLNQDASD